MEYSQEQLDIFTEYLEYLDGDPPLDNSEVFSALEKNKPNWKFDACGMYWKFHKEIAGSEFNITPSDSILELLTDAIKQAAHNNSYLSEYY